MLCSTDKFYAEITIKVHQVDKDGVVCSSRTRSIMHSDNSKGDKLANECAARTKVAINDTIERFMMSDAC